MKECKVVYADGSQVILQIPLPKIVPWWMIMLWYKIRFKWYKMVRDFLIELFLIYPLAALIIILTGNTSILDKLRRHKDEDSDRDSKT